MTLDQPHSSPDDVDLDDDRDNFYTPTNHETKNARISQNNSPLLEVSTEMQTRSHKLTDDTKEINLFNQEINNTNSAMQATAQKNEESDKTGAQKITSQTQCQPPKTSVISTIELNNDSGEITSAEYSNTSCIITSQMKNKENLMENNDFICHLNSPSSRYRTTSGTSESSDKNTVTANSRRRSRLPSANSSINQSPQINNTRTRLFLETSALGRKSIADLSEMLLKNKNSHLINNLSRSRDGSGIILTFKNEAEAKAFKNTRLTHGLEDTVLRYTKAQSQRMDYLIHAVPSETPVEQIERLINERYKEVKIHSTYRLTRQNPADPANRININIVKITIDKKDAHFFEHGCKIGFRMCKTSVPPPKPVVRACGKCYRYEHSTDACPVPSKKCPQCGRDHDVTSCPKDRIRCFNCGSEEHPSLSKDCPVYKRELYKKREEDKRKQIDKNKSYAKAAADKAAMPPPSRPMPFPGLIRHGEPSGSYFRPTTLYRPPTPSNMPKNLKTPTRPITLNRQPNSNMPTTPANQPKPKRQEQWPRVKRNNNNAPNAWFIPENNEQPLNFTDPPAILNDSTSSGPQFSEIDEPLIPRKNELLDRMRAHKAVNERMDEAFKQILIMTNDMRVSDINNLAMLKTMHSILVLMVEVTAMQIGRQMHEQLEHSN